MAEADKEAERALAQNQLTKMTNRYLNRHIETAEQVLDDFLRDEDERVLHLYLKKYFADNRKYGKRDRRQIGDVVYLIIVRQLLGIDMPIDQLYENKDSLSASEIAANNSSLFLEKIRKTPLSDGMTVERIVARYLRPSRTFFYTEKKIEAESTLLRYVDGVPSVPVGTSISQLMGRQKFFVQDISSQKIWEHYTLPEGTIWDVCSGAGGKALMCRELYPQSLMYCSDRRKNSLHNLLDRFDYMELASPEVFVADMTIPKTELPFEQVNSIVADLPCSGAATWHRQPEQALVFDPASLERYARTQNSITTNSLDFLTEGGMLVYITCSYFRAENEDVVEAIKKAHGLELVRQTMVDYFDDGGDALFLSVLRRS